MTTEPLRRRSLLPVQSHQPPAVSEAEIAAVASRNGFQPAPTPSGDTGTTTPRRQRQLTGRVHQFNVRLRRETVDFIYEQANSRNVPIAQVIEEMAEALKHQQKGRRAGRMIEIAAPRVTAPARVSPAAAQRPDFFSPPDPLAADHRLPRDPPWL